MTGLRAVLLLLSAASGDYAVLALIYDRLIHFALAAGIFAGSSLAAGVIAYAGRRRRKALAQHRARAWERRLHRVAADGQ